MIAFSTYPTERYGFILNMSYNFSNEFFQTGTIDFENNMGIYVLDVLMDITLSGLYVGHFGSMTNVLLGTVYNAITDSAIDIAQTHLWFSPQAQQKLQQELHGQRAVA